MRFIGRKMAYAIATLKCIQCHYFFLLVETLVSKGASYLLFRVLLPPEEICPAAEKPQPHQERGQQVAIRGVEGQNSQEEG
jgi:hypothetical protein